VTVTGDEPGAPALTVNDPVTVPARMPQVIAVTAGPVIEQCELPVEKPVPETDMMAPMGPEGGVSVTTCGIMFSVALAEANAESVTVIRSLRPPNVTRTTNCAAAVKVKSAATHTATFVGLGLTDAPVMAQLPAAAKLVPVMLTVSPTRAGLGVSVCEICGTTLKVLPAEPAEPPGGVHVSVSVAVWAGIPAPPTLNDPLTVCPDTDTV
jgi:hypothetical protein